MQTALVAVVVAAEVLGIETTLPLRPEPHIQWLLDQGVFLGPHLLTLQAKLEVLLLLTA